MSKNKKLKILFLPAWYPTEENPAAGIFIREHARAVNLYHDVSVIYAYPDILAKDCRLYQVSKDVEYGVKSIKIGYGGIFSCLWKKLKFEKQNFEKEDKCLKKQTDWHPLSSFFRICRIIIREIVNCWVILVVSRRLIKEGWMPDIIHVHVSFAGMPALILGKIYNIPIAISEHSSAFLRHKLGFNQLISLFLMRRAKIILPVSEILRKAIESYDIKNKFEIIPNVVNTDIFYPSLVMSKNIQKKILLITSFLSWSIFKNTSCVLKALSQFKQKRQDFILDIIGDGPERRRYEKLAKKLEIDKVVKFWGSKSHMEVARFIRNCNFFVQSSLSETFSVVCIEAMACGKPIVATQLPVFQEKIDKNRGILVPPKDIDALAKAIDYMLEHYQDYSSEGISQYAKENFSYETVGNKISKIYREILFCL